MDDIFDAWESSESKPKRANQSASSSADWTTNGFVVNGACLVAGKAVGRWVVHDKKAGGRQLTRQIDASTIPAEEECLPAHSKLRLKVEDGADTVVAGRNCYFANVDPEPDAFPRQEDPQRELLVHAQFEFFVHDERCSAVRAHAMAGPSVLAAPWLRDASYFATEI
jgi:hypothetical protein